MYYGLVIGRLRLQTPRIKAIISHELINLLQENNVPIQPPSTDLANGLIRIVSNIF